MRFYVGQIKYTLKLANKVAVRLSETSPLRNTSQIFECFRLKSSLFNEFGRDDFESGSDSKSGLVLGNTCSQFTANGVG